MKNVINIINLVYLNLYHRISLYHVVVTAKIYLKKKSILYLLKPFKFAIFSMQFVDKHSFLKKWVIFELQRKCESNQIQKLVMLHDLYQIELCLIYMNRWGVCQN